MRELGGVTSTWANLPRVTRRCIQAISMPLAWVVTLGLCAASAFAVRDTVFPTLGHSASPSMWEPSSDVIAATAPTYSGDDDLDVAATTPHLAGVPTPTVLELDLGEAVSTLPEAGASVSPEVRVQTGPPFHGASDDVPGGSSGSSSGGGGSSATGTTLHSAPSTSSPGPSTSAVTPTTSASSPSTTDPATTDSIGGSQNGRGSGSGGGGGTDDDHP